MPKDLGQSWPMPLPRFRIRTLMLAVAIVAVVLWAWPTILDWWTFWQSTAVGVRVRVTNLPNPE